MISNPMKISTEETLEKFTGINIPDYSWETLVDTISKVWATQITSVDGSPITLGKIFLGIFILVFGILISKKLTRSITSRLTSRLFLKPSVKNIIESISYYILIVFFFFFALKIANIPLTVFNLVGGAIAIGIGFGSQNVINNFISGLIIMLEGPVKIGDFVEVEGTYGRVEEIGMRSTILSSIGNRHYILPNSKLIQNQIHNWTLKDHVLRTSVSVGVAYGSPIDVVEATLIESAKNIDVSLKNKEIIVVFEDFGDSALMFDTYFHLIVKDHFSLRKAQSDLRKEIYKNFNAKEITIAFPQQDLNIHMEKPFDVNLINEKPRS